MLKNQRAYQYMMNKTGNDFVSSVVAGLAKFAGCAAVFGYDLFVGDKINVKKEYEKSLEIVNTLCPKPEGKLTDYTFLPNNDNVDLSIIVPAYNAEKYIKECVDSILSQVTTLTFKLIVVDDNSTDSTAEILSEYVGREDFLYIKNENGGSAASSRNKGLCYADGKYVMFVDSDDILLPDAIQKLYDGMVETGADIVQGGWQYLFDNGSLGAKQQYVPNTYSGLTRTAMLDLPGMPWGKMYNRYLFENVRFPSSINCFEDAIIHFLVFRSANKVVSIGDLVYAWRKNETGITSTSQNKPRALQAYWMLEKLLWEDERLGLEHDDVYTHSLIMQMSNFAYACVSGMDEQIKRAVFVLCSNLYNQNKDSLVGAHLPYAISIGKKALEKGDYGLWKMQGKFAQLIR